VETALHATRAGGRVVLAGMPAPADLSAAWFRELEVTGSYASAQREEHADDRGAFDIAGELVRSDAVRGLARGIVRYPLYRWREAVDHASGAGRLGTVKVAFDPRSTR
jgi:threonine dehydrogenase-like Zn-dependent dehydrogenase